MRIMIEDIIMENKVDLVIAGHVHAYERLYPIYKSEVDRDCMKNQNNTYVNPKFTSHVVCGTGGNEEGSNSCMML